MSPPARIPARAGNARSVSRAQEPNQYGYGGEGTPPRPSPDELEDMAENIAVPADDLTAPAAQAVDEGEEER